MSVRSTAQSEGVFNGDASLSYQAAAPSVASPTLTLSPEREKAIRVIKVLLFSASVIPALVVGAIAAYQGYFDALSFTLVALGLFIGQAGGDYLYYYGTNFHTDQRDAHTKIFAGWRPFFADKIFKDEKTLTAGILCLAIDAIIGGYFVYKIGFEILLFAILGGLVAIFLHAVDATRIQGGRHLHYLWTALDDGRVLCAESFTRSYDARHVSSYRLFRNGCRLPQRCTL